MTTITISSARSTGFRTVVVDPVRVLLLRALMITATRAADLPRPLAPRHRDPINFDDDDDHATRLAVEKTIYHGCHQVTLLFLPSRHEYGSDWVAFDETRHLVQERRIFVR